MNGHWKAYDPTITIGKRVKILKCTARHFNMVHYNNNAVIYNYINIQFLFEYGMH